MNKEEILHSSENKIFKDRKQKGSFNSIRKKRNLFISLMLLFPMVQFLIFYVYVNFNSILLAFQKYDISERGYIFTGFENFAQVCKDILFTGKLTTAVKNSGVQFLLTLLIITPLNILSSYVVFKKCLFSSAYKIILFMPNLISSMVFVVNARILISYGFPVLFNNEGLNLLNRYESSSFWTVLLFGGWMGFANGLVVYLSAMSSIPKDIIEYGQLEPLSAFKELTWVVIPSIFPTIITYVVVALAGFFTNAGYFYSFFGGNSNNVTPFDTLGYFFFVKVAGDGVTLADYPYAAAGGLLFTMIVAPITLTTKYLMEKYGPSED